jgi:dTDP-4-amino-4,6-dideoxygalactose transaminase
MMKITEPLRMVDLQKQYLKIKNEIDTAVMQVIESTQYIGGPEVTAFKEELASYLGASHVITCANGTDALTIAMMALELKPGDEVIVPSFTYVATAEVIGLLQLKPVMVDVDPHTFNITPSIVEKAITPKTKAIVPVHLFGQSAPMKEIMKIAEDNHLYVIEDNAQAIGADYNGFANDKKKTGTVGHIGCTSFFPSKNLGCFGDGGAICTDDEILAGKLAMVANHGQVKRYYHDYIGMNSRLDAMQAAVLRIKLKYLDDYCQARRKAANLYDQRFAGMDEIETPVRASFSSHVFHQYTLKVPAQDRNKLIAYLGEKGIPAMIYYPVPLYKQKAYAPYWESGKTLPVTEDLCDRVISLPMHTELDEGVIDYIADHVVNFFQYP